MLTEGGVGIVVVTGAILIIAIELRICIFVAIVVGCGIVFAIALGICLLVLAGECGLAVGGSIP